VKFLASFQIPPRRQQASGKLSVRGISQPMGYQRLKTLPVPFNVNFLVARRKFPPFFSPISLFFLL
jgi:hypothetical protein